MNNISLLDCTLRDGGYINDWNFGKETIKNIIAKLVDASIDYVEIGFLRDEKSDENRSVYRNCEEISRVLPCKQNKTKFVAMALHNKYNIDNLEPYDGKTVEIIRVTFHDYDIDEGLEYARKVKEKGYKVFCNPINIMGYRDEEIIALIHKVNEIMPYGFSIVDTFGTAMQSDLSRIYYLVEHNLEKNIVIGLHLHENLSLSYSLAQNFIGMVKERKCIIDGSLLGMGREPGNLCLELIVDYINRVYGVQYDVNPMLDAIDDYIKPLKERHPWGYNIAYALSAKYNLHRNYAEYLLGKGRLRARQINYLLASISENKKPVFDEKYIENLFLKYQSIEVDDNSAKQRLLERIAGRKVLILAPGTTIKSYQQKISEAINMENMFIIAANFTGNDYDCHCKFFSNIVRFENAGMHMDMNEVYVTSNIMHSNISLVNVFNYSEIVIHEEMICDNCVIMLLRLLLNMGIKSVAIAGFDGFAEHGMDYAEQYLDIYQEKNQKNKQLENKINQTALRALRKKMLIEFITPSLYENEIIS